MNNGENNHLYELINTFADMSNISLDDSISLKVVLLYKEILNAIVNNSNDILDLNEPNNKELCTFISSEYLRDRDVPDCISQDVTKYLASNSPLIHSFDELKQLIREISDQYSNVYRSFMSLDELFSTIKMAYRNDSDICELVKSSPVGKVSEYEANFTKFILGNMAACSLLKQNFNPEQHIDYFLKQEISRHKKRIIWDTYFNQAYQSQVKGWLLKFRVKSEADVAAIINEVYLRFVNGDHKFELGHREVPEDSFKGYVFIMLRNESNRYNRKQILRLKALNSLKNTKRDKGNDDSFCVSPLETLIIKEEIIEKEKFRFLCCGYPHQTIAFRLTEFIGIKNKNELVASLCGNETLEVLSYLILLVFHEEYELYINDIWDIVGCLFKRNMLPALQTFTPGYLSKHTNIMANKKNAIGSMRLSDFCENPEQLTKFIGQWKCNDTSKRGVGGKFEKYYTEYAKTGMNPCFQGDGSCPIQNFDKAPPCDAN